MNIPNKIKIGIVCFLLAFLFSSCSSHTSRRPKEPVIGGPCTYTSVQGQATIVSLNSAGTASSNCNNNPVKVVFDFTPDDLADANNATDKNRFLTVGDGKNPSLNYVLSKGLTIGSTHPCTRRNIMSGTCSPVIFIFTDIDLSDYAGSCF